MEFKTEAHSGYEKTRGYLHALFGEVNVKVMDDTFVLQERVDLRLRSRVSNWR